jgi:acyl carrier protein
MSAPVLSDLKGAFSESTGISVEKITIDSTMDDLGLDSAAAADFAANIQTKYSIQINAEELAQLNTVDDFYRLIVQKTS